MDTSSTSTTAIRDPQASTVNLNSSLFQHALDDLVGLHWVELTGDVLHLAPRPKAMENAADGIVGRPPWPEVRDGIGD